MKKALTVGNLLIFVGVLHFVLGISVDPFKLGTLEILKKGFFNTVGRTTPTTALAFWYHVAGGAYVLMGLLCNSYERDAQRPIPGIFGWALLILSVFAVGMAPQGGFWGGIAIAGAILWKARKA